MNEAEIVKLSIASHPKSLPVVRSAAERMAKMEGFSEQDANELALAIDEALANVIKHGYSGQPDKPIDITLSVLRSSTGDPGLCIVVRDNGRQVDPDTIQSRDLDDLRPGGLGVHIIKTVMDEVEYSCPPDGGMQLRMVKYVSRADDSSSEGERGTSQTDPKDGDHG